MQKVTFWSSSGCILDILKVKAEQKTTPKGFLPFWRQTNAQKQSTWHLRKHVGVEEQVVLIFFKGGLLARPPLRAPGSWAEACPGRQGRKREEVCGCLRNPRRVTRLHVSTPGNGNSDQVCLPCKRIPTDSDYSKVLWWKKLADMEGTYHRLKPSFSSWLINTNLSNNSGNCGFMLSLSTTRFAAPQKGSVMPSSLQIQRQIQHF